MSKISRPAMLNAKKPFDWLQVFTVLLGIVAIFTVFAQIWLNQTCFGVYVSGTSMYRTLDDGDFIYSYRDTSVATYGDVVIIDVKKYREEDNLSGDFIIKRLIALEGDSVYCKDGTVYLKKAGESEYSPLAESYAFGRTGDFSEVVVGRGGIFFLGDNRVNSLDSRKLGCYLKTDVVGVVPAWAIEWRETTTAWERFRDQLFG